MAKSKRIGSDHESVRTVFWRGVIEEWERSGVSQAEFCRQRRVSLSSLRWWRWSLKKRDRRETRPTFLPIRVVPGPLERTPERESDGFEVLLRQGYCVRVPRNFEAESLLRLLGVLETSRC